MAQINTVKHQEWIKSSVGDILENINRLYLFVGISVIASWFLFDLTVTLILNFLFVDILISKWMARSGPPGLGFETASLATIIAGFEISPTIGGLLGAVSIILRMGFGLSGAFILWKIPGFAVLGKILGTLINNILPQAILALIFMRIIFIASSNLLENTGVGSKISFSLTNIIFVYFLSVRMTKYGLI